MGSIKSRLYRLLLWLQSKAVYWRLRYHLRKFGAERTNLQVSLRTKRESLEDALKALATILREAGWSLLVAILTVAVILLFEQSEVWLKLESAFKLPSTVQSISARLYGTIASLAGLFVSLYFTAVGFLTSALYGGGSSELRSTALSERISNFYVRFVIWTGAISLCFLTVEALGFSTHSPAIVVVSTAGILALLAAGTLLGSTLRFFNPSSFAAEARRNLVLLFDYFGAGSKISHQNAFQSAARQRARDLIELFEESLRLCESENQPTALAEIGGHAVSLLNSYWEVKPTLPSESGWWQPVPESEDWFLSSSVDMALKSGWSLQREEEYNRMWMERELGSSIARTLKKLLNQERWADAAELLGQVTATVDTGGEKLLVEEATTVLSEVETALLEYTNPKADRISQDRGVRLSHVWDVYGAAHVQLLIGAKRGLKSAGSVGIERLLSTVEWQNEEAASTASIMVEAKERLEKLGEKLRFERTVEDKILTPKWYQIEYLLPSVLDGLHKRVHLLRERISNLQEDVIPYLENEDIYFSACELAERGLEIQTKWEHFAEAAQETNDSLRELERAEDFELPRYDWEALSNDLESTDQRAVDLLINCAPRLLPHLNDSRAQEVIGRAYSISTDRCAEAVISGRTDRFSELFEEAFNLGVFLYGRVPLKDVDLREWDQVRVGIQPLLDVMSLSGLALIRDEIDGPGFWKLVRETWNDFLEERDSTRDFLKTLLRIGGKSLTEFGVMPRLTIRIRWRQSMQDELRDRGFLSRPRATGNTPGSKRPLLEAVLAGGHGIEDPINVFLAAIIALHPESIGLKWPREVRSFLNRWT